MISIPTVISIQIPTVIPIPSGIKTYKESNEISKFLSDIYASRDSNPFLTMLVGLGA